MKFLALEQELPGVRADQYAPHLEAEAAAVWRLYQSGLARELYFRQHRPSAVLVLECADLAEAQVALASLPLVQAGLIVFDLIPLRPYSGFARLFKPAG